MNLLPIEDQFKSRAKVVGSVFLLQPEDAIDLVHGCRNTHVPVVGVEGFYLRGEKIQPSMLHSWSQADTVSDSYEATIGFLRAHIGTDLWFEVMIDQVRPS